jgi:hypothetical protein
MMQVIRWPVRTTIDIVSGWSTERGPPVSGKSTEVRVELAGTDLERLVVVGGDLEYLMDLPCDRLLSHTEVRLVAGILRRLLVDDQLSVLWRPIGKVARTQPMVEATEIDSALDK